MAGHVVALAVVAGTAAVATDAGQGGFHVEQGPGDVHQAFALGGRLAGDDILHGVQLLFHQRAGLAQAEYGHGVGHLLQGEREWLQLAGIGVAAVHEAFQRVFYCGELFGKRLHHGVHGLGVRAGHPLAFFIDQIIGRQRFIQPETGFYIADARAVHVGLGHVVEQVFDQFGGGWPVQAGSPFYRQLAQVAVHVTKHQFDGGAENNGVF